MSGIINYLYEGEVCKMKKKIIALLLTVTTVISLSACGGPFTCDICGEEKTGKKHTKTIADEKITYCDDKDCKDAVKLLEGLADLMN